MGCKVIKNMMGKNLTPDTWSKGNVDNVDEQVTRKPKKGKKDIVAHVREVRGGLDITIHTH